MSTLTQIKPLRKKKLSEETLKKIREKDHKMVKGVFRCFEPRGGRFTFYFKKYEGDEVLEYTMVDGQVYDVPFMVAQHLNQNCFYSRHAYIMDREGNPIIDKRNKKVNRCTFESLEFQSAEGENF